MGLTCLPAIEPPANQECNTAMSAPQGGGDFETKLPASRGRLLLVISSRQ